MEVLIFLLVATVVVIGWWLGGLFSCVFLTIPIVGLMLLLASADGPAVGRWELGLGIGLAVIWLPRYIRLGMDH